MATSCQSSDDEIEQFCREKGVTCYRGSLNNVASRFKEVADKYHFDAFVRLCGDSPLLDTGLIARAAKIFLSGEFDLVTNTLKRTFPKGQSVEVVRTETFKRAYELMESPDEFEHATQYFYNNPDSFRIFNLTCPFDYSQVQLTIDNPEDIETFTSIVTNMK